MAVPLSLLPATSVAPITTIDTGVPATIVLAVLFARNPFALPAFTTIPTMSADLPHCTFVTVKSYDPGVLNVNALFVNVFIPLLFVVPYLYWFKLLYARIRFGHALVK